jgi:hypothetical protein
MRNNRDKAFQQASFCAIEAGVVGFEPLSGGIRYLTGGIQIPHSEIQISSLEFKKVFEIRIVRARFRARFMGITLRHASKIFANTHHS